MVRIEISRYGSEILHLVLEAFNTILSILFNNCNTYTCNEKFSILTPVFFLGAIEITHNIYDT